MNEFKLEKEFPYEIQNYKFQNGFINWSMKKILFVRKY